MAEDKTGTEGGSEAGQNDPSAEETFWKKFDERVGNNLDSWFEKKRKELRENATSRNGGRMSLPRVLAEFMGGPFNPPEK